MTSNHTTILSDTVFNLRPARATAPVEVQLRYEPLDTYAVCMILNAGGSGQVEWVIARDLLAEGLIAASGEGDVRISPCTDTPELTVITMNSDSGQATFEAATDGLAQFLNDSYDLVAVGDEHRWMNIDDTLSRLLPNTM